MVSNVGMNNVQPLRSISFGSKAVDFKGKDDLAKNPTIRKMQIALQSADKAVVKPALTGIALLAGFVYAKRGAGRIYKDKLHLDTHLKKSFDSLAKIVDDGVKKANPESKIKKAYIAVLKMIQPKTDSTAKTTSERIGNFTKTLITGGIAGGAVTMVGASRSDEFEKLADSVSRGAIALVTNSGT